MVEEGRVLQTLDTAVSFLPSNLSANIALSWDASRIVVFKPILTSDFEKSYISNDKFHAQYSCKKHALNKEIHHVPSGFA